LRVFNIHRLVNVDRPLYDDSAVNVDRPLYHDSAVNVDRPLYHDSALDIHGALDNNFAHGISIFHDPTLSVSTLQIIIVPTFVIG
jgi:hypothetical protein